MSGTHTKVSAETFPMDCVENGCSHGGEHLENCPSRVIEICKECSDEAWDEHEGGVILWSNHQKHLDERVLDSLDFDDSGA